MRVKCTAAPWFLQHHRHRTRTPVPVGTFEIRPQLQSLCKLGDKTLPHSSLYAWTEDRTRRRAKAIPVFFTARLGAALVDFLCIFGGFVYRGRGRFGAQSLWLLPPGFSIWFRRKQCWWAMGGSGDGGSCNLLQVLFGRGIFFFHKQRFASGSNAGFIWFKFSHPCFSTFRLDYAQRGVGGGMRIHLFITNSGVYSFVVL